MTVEKLPAAQPVQAEVAEPVVATKRPAAHGAHATVPVVAAYWPAAQPTQLADAAPPVVVENVPKPQPRHKLTLLPTAVE